MYEYDPTGTSRARASNDNGENADFLPINRYISETIEDRLTIED